MDQERITLAHGAGGQKTAELIERLFARHFQNPDLTADDAAVLSLGGTKIAMTTDGFIVSPWRFPGGNIGELSICGTVNDLTCMGARPRYLTCAFQIEEGFPLRDLDAIAASMAETARACGVTIVAGDTKVAGRGQVDGCFITTTGIGELLPSIRTGGALARPGDDVLVTGDIGRHGSAILLARDSYGIEAEVTSDCAPLWPMMEHVFAALPQGDALHTLRDATRGGVGTVLYEIARESGVGIELRAEAIPCAPAVQGITGLLGLNPLYLACEGRLVLFCAPAVTDAVLAALHETREGAGATRIGTVSAAPAGRVSLITELGTRTLLPPPTGELLPRIC